MEYYSVIKKRKILSFVTTLMLKAQPLYTDAKSNLWDRVLGEIEKNSFIALPGKWGHSGLLPSKTMCPLSGTRILLQGCTIVSWLFLPWPCIPSLPGLATVRICLLELREGHGGWTERLLVPRSPYRVLLSFNPPLFLWYSSILRWTDVGQE